MKPGRKTAVVALASAATFLGMSAGVAPGASAAPTKTIQVHSTYEEPVPEADGVRCPGYSTGHPNCAVTVSGYAYFSGTFQGTAHYELESKLGVESKSPYEGDGNQFDDVVVDGCGRGAFHMDESEGYIDFGKYDPVTNSAPGYNKWRIRPGSATGDLVGLSGEGENNWRFYLSGYLPTAGPRDGGKGLFTGIVSCPGVPASSSAVGGGRRTASAVHADSTDRGGAGGSELARTTAPSVRKASVLGSASLAETGLHAGLLLCVVATLLGAGWVLRIASRGTVATVATQFRPGAAGRRPLARRGCAHPAWQTRVTGAT